MKKYLVKHAQTDRLRPNLQDVLDDIPEGYHLHSVTSYNQGGGYTGMWLVVFEHDEVSQVKAGG